MAKPRRKHVNFSGIAASPQGRHFLSLAASALGTKDFQYRALESLKDGTHLFLLAGPSGFALLVDRKEKADGNEWLNRYGILFEPPLSPVTWQIELVTHRWDPWLHAKTTGDATVRDSPTAKRYRVSDALREESGRRKDRMIMRVRPFDQPPSRVAGIPREVVETILAKHGLRADVFADLALGAADAVGTAGSTGTTGRSLARTRPEASAEAGERPGAGAQPGAE